VMEPNEALLFSIESILDDDELDNAGRNAALATTLEQYVSFTGAPHAKAILKRDDVDEVGKAVRPMSGDEEAAFDAHGSGPMHDELRARYDDQLRGRPHLTPEQAFAEAFRSLKPGARRAIRDEESGAYAARQAEEEALRQAALSGKLDKHATRTAAIAKANYAFHTVNAIAKQLREEDPRMTVEQARVQARSLNPELARKEREARLEALSA
jgi:hypothetical protein